MERRLGSTPVPTRRGMARSVGETSACISSRSGRVPSMVQTTAEPGCSSSGLPKSFEGSSTAARPGRGHLEDAELVRRAEAVLDGAQDAVRAVAVALEVEDAVDEVLEHARARDGALLRHVADEEGRDALLLGDAEEAAGRLAHLADRAGRRAELGRVERLHGVDHADLGPLALERRADLVEVRLGEDADVARAAQAVGAELHLRRGLLAGDEDDLSLGDMACRAMSRSVDLPIPGSPETSTRLAGTSPPPSTRSSSRRRSGSARRRWPRPRRAAAAAALGRSAAHAGRRGERALLDQVPHFAGRAAAEPLAGRVPALGARVLQSRLAMGDPV